METGQGDLDPFTDLLKWECKLISQDRALWDS